MLSVPSFRPDALPRPPEGEGRDEGTARGSTRLEVLNPLEHRDWDALLASFPDATFFHTAAWARVLAETYAHLPLYFCRFTNGQLDALLPLMEISSSITGRRGVSLPFTDLCPALARDPAALPGLYEHALAWGREHHWRTLELRGSPDPELRSRTVPQSSILASATPSLTFHAHELDLTPGRDALFKALDPATRRGIRKAQDARLQIEFSSQPEVLREYYALHCRTRRRHGLPPQPYRFFDNLARHALGSVHGFVVTARLEQRRRPVAAAVFCHHGRQALFKFGASDFAFQHLRPNNLVMWEAIKRLAEQGFSTLHLGRTSLANEGLRRFKLGFGAREHPVCYCKYDFTKAAYVTDTDRAEGWHNHVFRHLPLPLLRLAGWLLYPHLA